MKCNHCGKNTTNYLNVDTHKYTDHNGKPWDRWVIVRHGFCNKHEKQVHVAAEHTGFILGRVVS